MLTKEFRIFSLNVHLRGMPFAEFEEETRIVVWNPCTGQTKWNQPRYPYRQSDTYSLGPYQDSNCGNTSYKILRHELDTEYRVSLRGKTYWFAGDILSTTKVRNIYHFGSDLKVEEIVYWWKRRRKSSCAVRDGWTSKTRPSPTTLYTLLGRIIKSQTWISEHLNYGCLFFHFYLVMFQVWFKSSDL
ncbi:hypothetical protein Bca4012_089800 [Brassica carinata]|uniref:F-box associated beta-propeller type 1 domain-containing protein n=2 Tax=Brassica TaxID=3705 RepID=A0A3P6GBL0_BRAOL|nr:unnamed protein product [Brassica napus]CDY46352.1 BnaC01g30180D [Brassica napus]VDD51499.1 unnamed protein product [Brassica oleracea]